MTIPCNNLEELQTKISSYLLDERPLNLDEMRNAAAILVSLSACCLDVLRICRQHKFNPYEKLMISTLENKLGLNI